MATIDDFGQDPTDTLNDPPLGGPTGWAAAVRDKLNELAASITTGLAGKLNKAGDTMTGELVMNPNGAIYAQKDADYGPRFSLSNLAGAGAAFTLVGGRLVTRQLLAGAGIGSLPVTLEIADPTNAKDAASKGYVDNRVQGGLAYSENSGIATVVFPVPYAGTPAIALGIVTNTTTSLMVQCRDASATGFTFSLTNRDDAYVGGIGVFWIACPR